MSFSILVQVFHLYELCMPYYKILNMNITYTLGHLSFPYNFDKNLKN